MPSAESREQIQKLLASLLIARKEATTTGVPIAKLDQDYREETGSRIPFRRYGHSCLVDFLQSLSQKLIIRADNGMHYVYPVPSEKTKHVSDLVAGQNFRKIVRPKRRVYRLSAYYPKVVQPPMRLDSRQLSEIVKLVKKNSNGMHYNKILEFARGNLNSNIDWIDLSRQLRDIRHEVEINGEWVFSAFVLNRHEPYKQQQPQKSSTRKFFREFLESAGCNGKNSNVKPAGFSGSDRDDFSADYYVVYEESVQKKQNCGQDTGLLSMEKKYHFPSPDDKPPAESSDYIAFADKGSSNEKTNDNEGMLINERTRIRLQKLIAKHPDGIWCADLPALYQKEYTIPLCYEELGFVSVIAFVSQLPEIFQCVRLEEKGDFKVFDVKSDPSKIKPTQRSQFQTLAALHNIYENFIEPTEAVPAVLSKTTIESLIPEGVMTQNETVPQICVTELGGVHEYIDVTVCDVYTPSFFWIHLYSRCERLRRFMEDLHDFYELNSKKYLLPKAVMQKGLNCACTYDGKWHRAIIKCIRPDNYITLMFYDYGTVKSYPAESIHFLHRRFSNLPAQAIPCGLYNVKPVSGTHWPRNVSCEFVSRTTNVLLVATIATMDTENNSMLVALTNTEGAEDFHINDWMVQSGLAVYGNMVCMRPRNYPLQRYLECKLLNPPVTGEELLSSDSKNLAASDALIEADLLIMRDYYDGLLQSHRETRARKESSLSSKERSGEGKSCFLQAKESQRSKENVARVVGEKIVMFAKEPTQASDGSSSVSGGESINRKKLKDLIDAHRKRIFNGPVDGVPKNQPPRPKVDQTDSEKDYKPETPTDESTTDKERKLLHPNEIVPLHLKSPGSIDSLPEFGTLRSRYGGHGRMEPIDWSLPSKTNDSEKKPMIRQTKVQEKPPESVNLAKPAVPEVKKTVEERKLLSNLTAKKNDKDNWTGPKIPVSKRALWNLVKNSQKENSSASSGVESNRNGETRIESNTSDENSVSVKKKTPIFSMTNKKDVPRTEKYGREGEEGHWEAVPSREMKKMAQNPETHKEALTLNKKEIFPKYAVLSNLPKAEKRFVRIINDVVLSKSAEDESAFVSGGNIKMRKDRKYRLKVMKKKLEEKRKKRVKLFIPEKILHAMRLSRSEEMKTSSESLGEIDEGSILSMDSTNSRSLAQFLQSKDSSSENSIEASPCPLDKKPSPRIEQDLSHKKEDLCSSVEKSSNTGRGSVETDAISKSPKETNAWFQDVRLKLSTPQRSLIRSNVNNTFNSTLDSDDLSPFEGSKAGKLPKLDAPDSSFDNSRTKEFIATDKREESQKSTNENCSDDSAENKKVTSLFSKTATPKEAPVFDDLNLESNDDEWDYSPGWLPPDTAPEACQRMTNYPGPSTREPVVIEELDAETKDPSDGSSFEISENVDSDMGSNGSSGHETDTDTRKTDTKFSTIKRDSPSRGNLRKNCHALAESYFPLDNDEPGTSSPSRDFPSEKKPLIPLNTNSSSNEGSPRRNASLQRSLSSANKRYSILSEIQKSPILYKSLSFAALDSSSSEEKSDSRYSLPLVRTIRNYF